MKLTKIRKIYKSFKCDICNEVINPARAAQQDLQFMGKVYIVETTGVPEVHMCGYCAMRTIQLLRNKLMGQTREEEKENGGNN